MQERRFAIVIGINDYDINPLQFCVNDALAVANILEMKCRFHKNDIYLITSDKEDPKKDISGHFDSALKQIEKDLRPSLDSIFFFFAGHGSHQFENSGLLFQDSFIRIADVFERLNGLAPKYQCYVVDACESGGKVLTRNQRQDSLIDRYISNTTGVLFMYATTENETAKEYSDIRHGLFTYYFLRAIDHDGNYDDEGVLTPNRIQDFIAKETLKESEFKQTPVIENRTVGYYPFAFQDLEDLTSNSKEQKAETNEITKRDKGKTEIEQLHFPEVPPEIRALVFTELRDELDIEFDQFLEKAPFENYEVFTGTDFSIYEDEVDDKLTDSIVSKSISEKVISMGSTFSAEREKIVSDLVPKISMLDFFFKKKGPEYRIRNVIRWNANRVLGITLFLESKSIGQVSCGISILIYQALYGLGLVASRFYLDYSGYTNEVFKGPFTRISAFKIHQQTTEKIVERVRLELKNFPSDVAQWNEKRQRDIEDFDNKSE